MEAGEAAARSTGATVLGLTDALDVEGAQDRARHETVGDVSLAAGQRAYDELDADKAYGHFDAAAKAYAQGDLAHHFDKLTHALVMRAASALAAGHQHAAREELAQLLAVAPDIKLPDKYFSPEELEHANRLRHADARRAHNTLVISTTARNARVYVDGVRRGVSPLTVRGLAPGDHYLTVAAPGYVLAESRARDGTVVVPLLTTTQSEPWEATLKQLRSPNGSERLRAAADLARVLQVDAVLLVGVGLPDATGNLPASWQRVEASGATVPVAGLLLREGDGLRSSDGAVGKALAAPLATMPASTPVTSTPEAKPSAPPVAATRQAELEAPGEGSAPSAGVRIAGRRVTALPWTLGGVGLGFFAASAVFAVAAQHEHAAYDGVHTIGIGAAAPYEVRGKRWALFCDIGLLAGIVSEGAAVGTFALGKAEP